MLQLTLLIIIFIYNKIKNKTISQDDISLCQIKKINFTCMITKVLK